MENKGIIYVRNMVDQTIIPLKIEDILCVIHIYGKGNASYYRNVNLLTKYGEISTNDSFVEICEKLFEVYKENELYSIALPPKDETMSGECAIGIKCNIPYIKKLGLLNNLYESGLIKQPEYVRCILQNFNDLFKETASNVSSIRLNSLDRKIAEELFCKVYDRILSDDYSCSEEDGNKLPADIGYSQSDFARYFYKRLASDLKNSVPIERRIASGLLEDSYDRLKTEKSSKFRKLFLMLLRKCITQRIAPSFRMTLPLEFLDKIKDLIKTGEMACWFLSCFKPFPEAEAFFVKLFNRFSEYICKEANPHLSESKTLELCEFYLTKGRNRKNLKKAAEMFNQLYLEYAEISGIYNWVYEMGGYMRWGVKKDNPVHSYIKKRIAECYEENPYREFALGQTINLFKNGFITYKMFQNMACIRIKRDDFMPRDILAELTQLVHNDEKDPLYMLIHPMIKERLGRENQYFFKIPDRRLVD